MPINSIAELRDAINNPVKKVRKKKKIKKKVKSGDNSALPSSDVTGAY